MFLPLEVPRVLTYLLRYIDWSGCVPPHSKGRQESLLGQLWCNTNHPYFVIGWIIFSSIAGCPCRNATTGANISNVREQWSSTVTVLDKFVGIPAALQRHVPTNLSLSSCLAVLLVAIGRQAAWRPGASHIRSDCRWVRRPLPFIRPQHPPERSRTFCVVSRHARHTYNSWNLRKVVCKTQHIRHSFVASSFSALLLTDTCRSTVGPGNA